MDARVDEMVSEGVVAAEVPIQSQGKTGNGSRKSILAAFGKKSLPQGGWQQIRDVQPGIVDDVGFVIKLKGSLKGVGIYGQDQQYQQDKDCSGLYPVGSVIIFQVWGLYD
jgi:hypothetical protein